MIITTIPDRVHPGASVAKIEDVIALFDKGVQPPQPNTQMDVMITSTVFGKQQDSQKIDFTKPRMFFIRPVTPHFTKIQHLGFQSVIVSGVKLMRAKAIYEGRELIITAGRVGFHIADPSKGDIPRPGHVYVSTVDLISGTELIRAEGVHETSQLRYHFNREQIRQAKHDRILADAKTTRPTLSLPSILPEPKQRPRSAQWELADSLFKK